MTELMTTREVAAYLRIKERKVYDLVREGRIPCTRVTGKWLFPKALIDLWVMRARAGPAIEAPSPPAVIAGSHDPLLEWAIRESGAGLALLPGGSLDGLTRLARREAMACALHVYDAETDAYNEPLVRSVLGDHGVVLIEWARRHQGLISSPDARPAIGSLADIARASVRVIPRQEGAGAQILLAHLLGEAGIDPGAVDWVAPPARTETDVGLAIVEDRADVGLALEAVARQHKLSFVPLQQERLDLAIRRRDYFAPAMQALFAFARGKRFAERAKAMGGYDVSGLGAVHYNGP